jgi:preprotein translocase subunit Sec61beta
MQMPGVFGGLMRYDSEFKSRFMLKPTTIIAFLVLIIVFVLAMKIFWPINTITAGTGGSIPIGNGGLYIPLI